MRTAAYSTLVPENYVILRNEYYLFFTTRPSHTYGISYPLGMQRGRTARHPRQPQERHHLARHPLFRDTPRAMRVTALLFLLSLGVQMTAVRAAEAEEPIACESPHQVASVAMAVTDSCGEGREDSGAVSGGFRLPEHCSVDLSLIHI